MRYFVYSKLTCDHDYTNWSRDPNDPRKLPQKILPTVLIRGGANLATDPDGQGGRFTPGAIRSEITESQLAYLKENKTFLKHEKQGLILVLNEKSDPEEIARQMAKGDGSKPLTPEDPHFGVREDGQQIKPTVLDKVKGVVSDLMS